MMGFGVSDSGPRAAVFFVELERGPNFNSSLRPCPLFPLDRLPLSVVACLLVPPRIGRSKIPASTTIAGSKVLPDR